MIRKIVALLIVLAALSLLLVPKIYTDEQHELDALKTKTFIVEKSGHLPHLEHPQIVNAKILSFLREN